MMDSMLPLVLAQDAPTAPPSAPPPPPSTPTTEAPATPGTPTTAAPGDPTLPPPGRPPSAGFDPFMLILLGGFALMLFFMFSGQRREKKKREAMLSSLKKGDRVLTVGGILGNVVEIRDNEVVVKVDENSNTRLRFSRAAIQSVEAEKAE